MIPLSKIQNFPASEGGTFSDTLPRASKQAFATMTPNTKSLKKKKKKKIKKMDLDAPS